MTEHVHVSVLIASLAVSLLPAAAVAAPPAGAADFNARCGGCHSTHAGTNGVGPSLDGVYGRTSGTEAGYKYSPAMKSAKIVWNDQTLNQFLQNPNGLVHGAKMFISVPDATTRQNIIGYLKGQNPQPAAK